LSLPLYIVAGGRSARFGSDKARAELEGAPLLIHAARALEPVTSSVTVVADRADKYADLGLRTIADRATGLGPLGGLQAALEDLPPGDDWLLLGSCDLLGLRARWVEALREAAVDPHGVVAFRAERWEPMPALYHRRVLLAVNAAIAADELTLWRLIERCDPAALPVPAGWDTVAQVNTPADLERQRLPPAE
jgi:molybdopterin-guanine dinucleotide biosynthesis protein A